MASGAFFDPLKLLRVAPLVSSTAALWFAVDQEVFLSNFQQSVHGDKANAILPTYWKILLPKALWILGALHTVTVGTSIANIALQGEKLRSLGATRWYWGGVVFSVAHFTFAPLVMYKIKDIVEDNTKGHSTRVLAKWLRVHRIRTVLVDFVAFTSFLMAATA
ncbi:integral membrane protein, putative [Paecilomyces variotii No. 5]|uniref:Integral membrane protein, putative n=1 Tax=Byssochlamys spectabilis (strain No. 5 / NBRC 109023) TaxID=1356009 RepID=V5G4S2_BYSSN|nr:integral membrane protein, putative [Paecilomyces variotii No. 5]